MFADNLLCFLSIAVNQKLELNLTFVYDFLVQSFLVQVLNLSTAVVTYLLQLWVVPCKLDSIGAAHFTN